ncbi:sulfite exporter TauE/SafE family protein [Sulfitobacter sp. F26204]|uniref:sulfite exporter TauE/SafE family protein n=1 Tax=Sulfitobacter sp. F26204 TaxID=2996014 RepID=UPI00225DEE99|nr:sulfite exporter TauE/SafE family protein [Sulfitobacter sp. F26204]MCX7558501.1 sulfite exporter TauE/SafE family protein [Sulfitobacter sp. F26204]
MDNLWSLLSLTLAQGIALSAIFFAAGLVKGFTGFALSAFSLALAVLILPPVELLPMMWWPELGASLLMMRGGWDGANIKVAAILTLGSMTGVFVGLGLTTRLDPKLSAQIALVILITLAILQLAKVRLRALDSTTGTGATGVVAGIVTGLAGVGGMVVALYILAREMEPKVMRATLVTFLFFGSFTSFLTHLYYGTMNSTSATRGIFILIPCLLGVFLGQKLFTPKLQPYYRSVCLTLLIGLGALSLLRSII